ncbi:MAG: CoA synthetase [Deltaproteobacteria bacterium]|nr:MAG: CoA synthetase [Deltaproteobacteria bacterium]
MPFPEEKVTVEEYMAYLISREVEDGKITGVGTLSPVPLLGTLLAKHTHAPRAKLIVLGDEEAPITEGSKELFDLAQRGKLDLFFLSGAQIDGKGNINLTCIGDYSRPKVRLPGGAGSAMLYYMSRRTVLFTLNHTKRVFVDKVDFVTSRGMDDYPWRVGGLTKVITPLAVFSFDRDEGRMKLESLHPGVTLDEVRENTGFPVGEEAPTLSPPLPDEILPILRNKALPSCERVYPAFAKKLKEKISRLS